MNSLNNSKNKSLKNHSLYINWFSNINSILIFVGFLLIFMAIEYKSMHFCLISGTLIIYTSAFLTIFENIFNMIKYCLKKNN